MIPLTWDNLRQFFEWASEQDAYDSPYVLSWSDEAVTIDGYVTRKNFQAWLAQQEGSAAPAVVPSGTTAESNREDNKQARRVDRQQRHRQTLGAEPIHGRAGHDRT